MIFKKRRYPGFLESEIGAQNPDASLFHVIPVPLEKTVSYGKGTSLGPLAILNASQELELFDGKGIPAERGIFTHRPVDCRGSSIEVIERICKVTLSLLKKDKIPCLIGGEHSLSLGPAMAVKECFPDAGVIQFDAHADLRDTYYGDKYSHACVMRRIYELGMPILQVGVRSLSVEEVLFRKENKIVHFDSSDEVASGRIDKFIPDDFPEKVYVTIDIDALDPGIIPSTGTPEPGGLSWYALMRFLNEISAKRNVVGFDLVELSPIKNFIAPDFTAARLIYNFMGMI